MSRRLGILVLLAFAHMWSGGAFAETRICNTGTVKVNLAIAYDANFTTVHGWFALEPGKCRSDTLAYWVSISQSDRQGRRGIALYYAGAWQVPIFYDSNREFCVHPTEGFRQDLLMGNVCSAGHEKVPFTIYARKVDGGLFPSTLNIKTDPDIDVKLFSSQSAASKEAEKHHANGIANYNNKNYDQAIVDFTKAIDASPQFSLAYNDRGMMKYFKKDYEGAISDFTRAIDIFPKYELAFVNRGMALADGRNNQTQAIADFSKAIEINPNYAPAYGERGFSYLAMKNFASARPDCAKAIALDAKYSGAYACRARVNLNAGNAGDALIDVQKALELDANNSGALATRGEIYETQGKRNEAIAEFRKALAIYPEHERAKEGLKRLEPTSWWRSLTGNK
jgi:tetratricopeptide (TPR) repeat protein